MKQLKQSKNKQYSAKEVCYNPSIGEVVKILSRDGKKFIYVMRKEEGAGCDDCPLNDRIGEGYNCAYIPIWCGMMDSYITIDSLLENL